MTSPIWRYSGSDGKPLIIRSAPELEAARTSECLQPGEIFYVSDEQEGAYDITYLKLQDGRGWVFDSKPGVGGLCENIPAKLWHYVGVGDGQPLSMRTEPTLSAGRNGQGLKPGEPFYVSSERAGDDGVTFLQLADGRGWAFDSKPGLGVLCKRHEVMLRLASAEGLRSELWRYAAEDGKPINIRVEASIAAARTGEVLRPGEFFRVDEVVERSESNETVRYLRMSDGRGWLFDQKPGAGIMCVRHDAPVILHIYDVPRHKAGVSINNYLRAIGTGAFHAGVEVFNTEWSYGCQEREPGTGVFDCEPRGCEAHRYREAVPMGHTSLTQREVLALIAQMKAEWKPEDYSLLRQNCCHFSDVFLDRLGVGRTPAWVMNLAKLGAFLQDKKESFAENSVALLERGRDAGGRAKEVCVAGHGYAKEVCAGPGDNVFNGAAAALSGIGSVSRGFMKKFDCV